MLVLQFLEVVLELVMPWIQDKHLEGQCRRCNTKVRQRDDAGSSHCGGGNRERGEEKFRGLDKQVYKGVSNTDMGRAWSGCALT